MNISPENFETSLKAENFSIFATVDKAPGYAMAEHEHPFEACALITRGSITLEVAGHSTSYNPGDVFRLPAHTAHFESAGPEGVSYHVGRKYPAVQAV